MKIPLLGSIDPVSTIRDRTTLLRPLAGALPPRTSLRLVNHPGAEVASRITVKVDELKVRHGLTHQEIAAVDVEIFGWALQLGNRLEPESLTDIQYSLPYCIAIAAIEGCDALAPIGLNLLDRSDLTDFARRVRLAVDAEIDRRFPQETLARVTIVSQAGDRFVSSVTTPRGDAARPMNWADVREKFCRITAARISRSQQKMLLEGFDDLRGGDPVRLLSRLRQPI